MNVYRRDSRLPSFLFDDETQDLQQELAVVRGDYDKAKKVCGLTVVLTRAINNRYVGSVFCTTLLLWWRYGQSGARRGQFDSRPTYTKSSYHNVKYECNVIV